MEDLRLIKCIYKWMQAGVLWPVSELLGQQPRETAHVPKHDNELVWSAAPCTLHVPKARVDYSLCDLQCNSLETVKRKSVFACKGRNGILVIKYMQLCVWIKFYDKNIQSKLQEWKHRKYMFYFLDYLIFFNFFFLIFCKLDSVATTEMWADARDGTSRPHASCALFTWLNRCTYWVKWPLLTNSVLFSQRRK